MKRNGGLSKHLIIIFFLVAATLSVFGQVWQHEFISIYDDIDYIINNPHVQAGVTWDGVQWAFTTFRHHQWHPVTWLSHMLDCQLWGSDPGRHHLSSLFFHLANTLLLFFLLLRITGAPLRSGAVALLFALHPLHVEPVAMVSYRKDLLAGFFFFLSLHAYVSFARNGRSMYYCLLFVFFVLGLMSKAVIVTLPFLLLLLDYWPLCRFEEQEANTSFPQKSALHLLLEKVLLFIPMLVIAVVVILVRNPQKSLFRLPSWRHVEDGLVSYCRYLGKAVWPTDLAVIYPRSASFSCWQVLAAGCFLLLVTLLVIKGRKGHPCLLTGWLWYLLSLLPVIGILGFMGPHVPADRYLYLPLVGLFLMAAWGLPPLLARWRPAKGLFMVMAPLVIILLMTLSWFQTGYWKNNLFLFDHAVRVTSANFKAQNNLGLALLEEERLPEAVGHFQQSLAIKPLFVPARMNLATAYNRLGELHRTERQISEVLRIDPDHSDALDSMGVFLEKQGRIDEATEHFKRAVLAGPRVPRLHYHYGNGLMLQGKYEQALVQFREAVALDPGFAKAHNASGYVLTLLARHYEAASSFEEARANLNRLQLLLKGE